MRLCSTAAGAAAVAPVLAAGSVITNEAAPSEEDKLQSAFLFDLVFEKGPANPAGNRVVVGIQGGTFEGPKLKGTIAAPSGDWIVARPDGSSVLDMRIVLQTDDEQKIYMACRGIAYTPEGGSLFARILPMFETGAAKYAWLNNVVAAGVYRPRAGKIGYRVYQIL
jgi:hypothetical protein